MYVYVYIYIYTYTNRPTKFTETKSKSKTVRIKYFCLLVSAVNFTVIQPESYSSSIPVYDFHGRHPVVFKTLYEYSKTSTV